MHLVAPVLQQLDDGAAGDAGQNGAHAGGSVDLAVDLEHDVHGADFLDVLLLNAVQPQHLGEAALLGQLAGLDGRGVVAAALRKAGQARGGADVLILNIDADGVETLSVVGTGGRADDGKAVMLGGMNAQAHIGSDAERADVQGRTVGVGHPVAVHIDQRLDSLHEVLRRDGGHAETVRGIVKTVRVAVGAEQLDLAVCGAVGLHALKNFLCVVEHGGSRVHLPRAIGDIISHSPFYIQAHRRTAVRVMVRFIIALSRGERKPLFTKCVFCVAKSAIRVFPGFPQFSTVPLWKMWKINVFST